MLAAMGIVVCMATVTKGVKCLAAKLLGQHSGFRIRVTTRAQGCRLGVHRDNPAHVLDLD
jgi:hypothetical protein